MSDDAERAEQMAVDQDRSLPGEDLETTDREAAERWLAVYTELLAFKHDLIAEAEQRSASMLVAAAREVRETDLVVLRAEEQRLARRHELWRARVSDLG